MICYYHLYMYQVIRLRIIPNECFKADVNILSVPTNQYITPANTTQEAYVFSTGTLELPSK